MGSFIFEVYSGHPPFFTVDNKRMISRIVCKDFYYIIFLVDSEPDYKELSDDVAVKDLVQKLLNKDPV